MRLLRPAAPALFALSIAASAACSIELDAAQYVGKEDKSFAVSGTADVTIKTFDGSIQVTAWDKPEVAVTIERRADNQADADALKVKAEQTGGKVVIEALKPESEIHVGWTHGRSVSFVVHVPKQTNLSAKSGDGSIQASGVSGTVDLASGDGSIKAVGSHRAGRLAHGRRLDLGAERHGDPQYRHWRRQHYRGRRAARAESAHRGRLGARGGGQHDVT